MRRRKFQPCVDQLPDRIPLDGAVASQVGDPPVTPPPAPQPPNPPVLPGPVIIDDTVLTPIED